MAKSISRQREGRRKQATTWSWIHMYLRL
jgi:hypothetical protein